MRLIVFPRLAFPWPVMEAATRHRDRRNCVFEDQLFQVSRFQHEREFVEAADFTREFDATHQIDRHVDAIAAQIIQKPVLNVLRGLSIGFHFQNRLSLFYFVFLLFD